MGGWLRICGTRFPGCVASIILLLESCKDIRKLKKVQNTFLVTLRISPSRRVEYAADALSAQHRSYR